MGSIDNTKTTDTVKIIKSKRKYKTKEVESSSQDISNGVDFKNIKISQDLEWNRKTIENIFNFPANGDLIFRDFNIQIASSYKAIAIFMNGLVDKSTQHTTVFQPLMFLANKDADKDADKDAESNQPDKPADKPETSVNTVDYILTKIVPSSLVLKGSTYGEITDAILVGKTVVIIENTQEALIADTSGWKERAIEQPINEKTIRGPHESFNENFMSNIGLIRKALPDHNLMNEMIYIGTEQKNICSLMYLKNIANPSLVSEAKKRLSSIKTSYLLDSCALEQFIEDHPFMLFPQTRITERPDVVIMKLMEGKVAVLLNHSPNVIIFPVTFWSFLHSTEDAYLRFPFGTFLRLLRLLAAIITLFLPALYIGITNFHQEMIPTDLLFTIAGAREKVPFPTIVEIFILELSFELIRESGTRVPGILGPTLGILGVLILGQAAVAANIVSPLLIIIAGLTGLGSFAIPDFSMGLGLRLMRFVYMLVATVLGFYGISLLFFLHLALICNMKSFGVPYLSPIAPWLKDYQNALVRFPWWKQERTPDETNAIKSKSQPKISRGWIKTK